MRHNSVSSRRKGGRSSAGGPAWDLGDLVGYRRLDELQRIIDPVSSRVLKTDVFDLPPKLYSKRYFEMNPEQRRVYEAIRDECLAFLEDGGLVTAPLPITQLLRARQILSGYVPPDDPEDEPVRMLGKKNPRLELQLEECARTPHKGIIWCNFRLDADLLCSRLGRAAVRYDGAVSDDQKAANKHAFKTDPKVQWLVANQRAMSRGHTLTEAHVHYFYNNSFSYMDRIQAEDRSHRAGLTHPVLYVDLVGDAVDAGIIDALRKKMRTSNRITGDEEREWI
jgi:SNF2 family DNA or RNA helicase